MFYLLTFLLFSLTILVVHRISHHCESDLFERDSRFSVSRTALSDSLTSLLKRFCKQVQPRNDPTNVIHYVLVGFIVNSFGH